MRGLSRKGGSDTCWHVMNRGARKFGIFDRDEDYESMVRLLRIYTSKHGLAVYAYCVMPNHYHVLVRGPGERLSKCFHEVDRLAARATNERREGKGHVFQGTFRSFRQRTPGWMVRTSFYIHMNPLGSRVRKPGDYRWSSYGAYASAENGADWVETRPILKFLDPDPARARPEYRRTLGMRIGERKDLSDASEETRVGRTAAREIARSIDALAGALGVAEDEARRVAAHYGRRALGLPVEVLARELGFPSARYLSTVLFRMSERAAADRSLRKLLSRASDHFDSRV